MDYVLTTDSRQLEIPGFSSENIRDNLKSPRKTVDNGYIYDTNAGGRLIYDRTTVAKADSERKYWELFGYLRGRVGQSETIYLDSIGSTITGYIRITNTGTQTAGTNGKRRTMNIKIWEA